MNDLLLTDFVPSVVMPKQEEQQLAQKWVDMFNAQEGFDALDRLALGKHLAAVGKLVADMLTQAALLQTNKLIKDKTPCEKTGEPIQVAKKFVFHGNEWLYQIKETYNQLGQLKNPDGSRDPNSITYHSLEVRQEQMKTDSKALTAQMTGLKARLLNDHPKIVPCEIAVSLALTNKQ